MHVSHQSREYKRHIRESMTSVSDQQTSSSAMAERPRELGDFKKARVNGGTNNHSLKD